MKFPILKISENWKQQGIVHPLLKTNPNKELKVLFKTKNKTTTIIWTQGKQYFVCKTINMYKTQKFTLFFGLKSFMWKIIDIT